MIPLWSVDHQAHELETWCVEVSMADPNLVLQHIDAVESRWGVRYPGYGRRSLRNHKDGVSEDVSILHCPYLLRKVQEIGLRQVQWQTPWSPCGHPSPSSVCQSIDNMS